MLASKTGSDVTLTPTWVTEPDFTVLRELAGTIWRQHYTAIISVAQIEYMLAARFTNEALHAAKKSIHPYTA